MLALSAGRTFVRPGWKPTTAFRSVPVRASSRATGGTEAVPDGGEPVLIDRRLVEECSQRREAEGAGAVGVGEEVAEARHHRVAIGEGGQLAVVVEGEPDVSQFGQLRGPRPLDLVEPGTLVADEHARMRTRGVGDGKRADEHVAVGLVGDLADADHRGASYRRGPVYV